VVKIFGFFSAPNVETPKVFPEYPRNSIEYINKSLLQIFKLRVFVVFYSEAIAKPSRHCTANYDIRHFFFACTAQ